MGSNRLIVLAFSIAVGTVGCAAFDPGPPPLSSAEIIQLSKSGEPPEAIVDRLKRTDAFLWFSEADILQLQQSGVAPQVLDYLRGAQTAEAKRRRQFDQLLYGPEMTPFSRCGGTAPLSGRISGFFAPFC